MTSNNIKFVSEYRVKDKFFDIFVPGYNLLIDVNPTVSHTTRRIARANKVDIMYHSNRTDFANNNGYRLLHVFQWDDFTSIVKKIPNDVIDYSCCNLIFDILNNTTGTADGVTISNANKGLVTIRCLENDIERASLSFTVKDFCYVIQEFHFTSPSYSDCIYPLFEQFIRNFNPGTVRVTVDRSKYIYDWYKNLHFTETAITKPNKHWSKSGGRSKLHLTDSHVQQYGYDDMILTKQPTICDNLEETLSTVGIYPVYDCGYVEYVWNNERYLTNG